MVLQKFKLDVISDLLFIIPNVYKLFMLMD